MANNISKPSVSIKREPSGTLFGQPPQKCSRASEKETTGNNSVIVKLFVKLSNNLSSPSPSTTSAFNRSKIPQEMLELVAKKLPVDVMTRFWSCCTGSLKYISKTKGEFNFVDHILVFSVCDRSIEVKLNKRNKEGNIEDIGVVKNHLVFLQDAQLFNFSSIYIYNTGMTAAVNLLRNLIEGLKLYSRMIEVFNCPPEVIQFLSERISTKKFKSRCRNDDPYRFLDYPGIDSYDEIEAVISDFNLDGHYGKFKNFKKVFVNSIGTHFSGCRMDDLIEEACEYETSQFNLKEYVLGNWEYKNGRTKVSTDLDNMIMITDEGKIRKGETQSKMFLTQTRCGYILSYSPAVHQRSLLFLSYFDEVYVTIFEKLTEGRLRKVPFDASVHYEQFMKTPLEGLKTLFKDIFKPFPYFGKRVH